MYILSFGNNLKSLVNYTLVHCIIARSEKVEISFRQRHINIEIALNANYKKKALILLKKL